MTFGPAETGLKNDHGTPEIGELEAIGVSP